MPYEKRHLKLLGYAGCLTENKQQSHTYSVRYPVPTYIEQTDKPNFIILRIYEPRYSGTVYGFACKCTCYERKEKEKKKMCFFFTSSIFTIFFFRRFYDISCKWENSKNSKILKGESFKTKIEIKD